MPHIFDLGVRVNQNEVEKVHVEIADADLQLLAGFLDDFDRLAATRMGEHAQVSFTYKFDAATGVSWSSEMPPDDDVDAFLHRLRPFVLNNERSNFHRVCNVLGRAIAHPAIHALLRKQRQEFDGRAFQSQIQFFSNETVVNTEQVLQNWLNAHEYHRDPERREALAQIHHELLPFEATRPLFVSMLIDKGKAIQAVAAVVRLIVAKQKGQGLHFDGLTIPRTEPQA